MSHESSAENERHGAAADITVDAIIAAERQRCIDRVLTFAALRDQAAINLDSKDSFYTRGDIQKGLALAVSWYVKYQLQYTYLTREAWTGVGGAPKATNNMVFTGMRYYIP